jgi:hypothetical protein
MTVLAKAKSNLTGRPTKGHPKTGLHSATIISVLATFGYTAGRLLAACISWVDIAIMNSQRKGNQRVTQPAAIAIYKTGNRRIHKLQRLQSCKTGVTAQKEPAGGNSGVSKENILLEIRSVRSIIRCSLRNSDQ